MIMEVNFNLVKGWVDSSGWASIKHGEVKSGDHEDYEKLCEQVKDFCTKNECEWHAKKDRIVIIKKPMRKIGDNNEKNIT